MFHLIKRLFYEIGKLSERSKDTYKSQYKGQWKNKGNDHNENWQWVEKDSNKNYVVNIFQLENDFIITIGHHARSNAIETVNCKDDRELEIALRLLKTYYGTLGNVVIDTQVG
jgi:hypothetical protein